jgi:hypothetical protein
MDNRTAASLFGGRILSHGQITDLTEGFSLPDGLMFSLFVVPKTGPAEGEDPEKVIIVSCKTLQNPDNEPLPIVPYVWNEPAIKEIPADAIDLDEYDVYWGAGHNRKLEV